MPTQKPASTVDSVFYKELGKYLHNAREQRGITLRDLSKRVGVSRVMLDNWELGLCRIKSEQFQLLCKTLNCPSEFLVSINFNIIRND